MTNLHVFSDGTYWVVAESVDDAWKVWEECIGDVRDEYEDYDQFTQVPDDKVIDVGFDDLDDVPESARALAQSAMDCPFKVELRAEQWAQHNGRGFLSSTEF